MRNLRNIGAVGVAAIAFALMACNDASDRALTAPNAVRFSHAANPAVLQALIDEINTAIACVYANDPKEGQKQLKDFDKILKATEKKKEHLESVRNHVRQFIKDSDKLIASGKLTTACDGRDIHVAAAELYNLLYLLSDQPDKVTTPPYAGDAAVVVCLPSAPCELNTAGGASVRVPAGTFDVPVIISATKIIASTFDYTPFEAFGTPIPPSYEFSVHPNIAANGIGWGRYVCVSDGETHSGTLQLFRQAADGTIEAIPFDDSYILCPDAVYSQISNPLLRRAYRLASRIAAPFMATPAYALQHRAIGGPGVFGSPHVVVRLAEGGLIHTTSVSLGVNRAGQLNLADGAPPSSGSGTTTLGLRYLPTNAEALAPGCLCEGWGVADAATGVTGYANQSQIPATSNITVQSFTTSGASAVSVVNIGSTFQVTHDYHPSPATPYLFEVTVAIKNISPTTVADVRYRRVLDWDVEPTYFDEFVTIQGTSSASAVLFASDNGFASANPLAGNSQILFSGDAVNSGPTDHGALFDFGFGALAPGATKTFKLYYGAAGSESAALAALQAIGAEVYSLGKPNVSPFNGTPNTFMVGFTGVGGSPFVPSFSRISRTLIPSENANGTAVPRSGKPDPRNVRRP